jgi:hypothetical protein
MSSLMDFAARSFDASRPRPLGTAEPGAPPPPPPPERELTAAQVVGRGAEPPPWPGPDDLASVQAARQQLRDAEENLARLKKDIDAARAASAAKPPTAEDLKQYLAGKKTPERDKAAQAAAERAAALAQLLPLAQAAVEEARAAGRAAWEAAPAALWAAAEPEWRAAVVGVARTLAACARAQLRLRSVGERYFAHWRRHRLPEGAATPAGFHPRGLRLDQAIFDVLLHPSAPRASSDLIRFLEGLRLAGVLAYEGFDMRPLDAARATDEALFRMDDVLKAVAGQAGPEAKKPEPQKGN